LSPNTDVKATDKILGYARWSVSEQAGKLQSDTSIAVCCAFYEHLSINPKNWIYFNKWFKKK
jgi:hypothetical protein